MIWKPNVTVAAVIERDGHFLVVEEESADGPVINQPAGHLEENESLETAVIRETLEETGYEFSPTALIGSFLWQNPTNNITYFRVTYTGVVSDEPISSTLDEGIIRTLWMTRSQLEEQQARLRSPIILQTIDQYLLGKTYSLAVVQSFIND